MEFEAVLELYLAVEKAYAKLPDGVWESEEVNEARKVYEDALAESDFVDSEFYDYCVAEDLI